MKKLFSSLLLILALFSISSPIAQAQNKQDTFFPYPSAPEDLQNITERVNWVVTRFWDKCNFNTAFSNLNRMEESMNDFISLLPLASADTAYIAIDNLLEKIKKNPKGMLSLARMAEAITYSDTASVYSEAIYYPFVKAVVNNKKISSADRARFDAQFKILDNSQAGMFFPAIKMLDPQGNVRTMDEITAPNIIVMFSDPECSDCRLAKTRMAADYNINELLKKGKLEIIALYPEPDNEEWLQNYTSYPEEWKVWWMPEAYDYFEIPSLPSIYLLNDSRKIVGKELILDNIMEACRQLNNKIK